MKNTSILLTMLTLFYSGLSQAQELPKNLVYGNSSLKFEDILKVGEYTLLEYVPYRKQEKRRLYILDKSNLVIDEIKIYGGDHYIITSDSTVHIRGLNPYVKLKIGPNGATPLYAILTKSNFTEKLDPIYLSNKLIIGDRWVQENDCLTYLKTNLSDIKILLYAGLNREDYLLDRLDTIGMFDDKVLKKLSESSYDEVEFEELIPFSETCDRRVNNYYGWNNYSISGNTFTLYEKDAAKLFVFKIIEDDFVLDKSIVLPVKDKNLEGWKHFYDRAADQHYVVHRKSVSTKGMSKKEIKNLQERYSYTLYSLSLKTEKLKALFKLKFEPKLIDNKLIYEIVTEKKKGSSVYFHPIDPNYVYEKSTLVYSN